MYRFKVGKDKDGEVPVSTVTVQNPALSSIRVEFVEEEKSFWKFCYNRRDNTICGRNCRSWILIVAYAIMYLVFLGTFFNFCLLGSLSIIKANEEYLFLDKSDLYSFSDDGIGLTAIPLSETQSSVIWYHSGEATDYEKYITAIDAYLNKNDKTRQKRSVSEFGPCSKKPYGYGEEPCIFVKINRQRRWSAKPIESNSTKRKYLPDEVDRWIKEGHSKLWLFCEGINPWDKEHLGAIKYYPNPPGFDPEKFPLNPGEPSPSIAVQFTNITVGISLEVHCRVFYAEAVSKLEFVLYIASHKDD